jgi:hypothetical protein
MMDINIQLEKYGYAVIPNILTIDECINYRDRIWANLEYVSKNKFNHQIIDTWKYFELFNPTYSMLLHNHSLGHMQPIWDLRQHPSIYNVFENIWNEPVDNLLTSFDGLAVLLPPEKTNKGFISDEWYHTDQSSKKIGKHCIQSMITLYDINEYDSTISLLERSHLYHESFFIDNQVSNISDWYLLSRDQKEYFIDKACNEIIVKAKAGSMILWDSRTIHQAKGVDPLRSIENFRMVVYISMMPRHTVRNPNLLKNRIKAFNKQRISSHWSNSLFLFPNIKSDELNQIDKPVLNEIGRRLVGY